MGQSGFPEQPQGKQYLNPPTQEKKTSDENMMLKYMKKMEQIA